MKQLWLRIPRPCRAALNILAILALAAIFYVSIGAPTLTKEQSFRRAEKSNLLGPSTILFSEIIENYNYGHLILAETDNCVITWVDDSTYGFNYHQKTGDITVVAAPKYWFDWGSEWWDVNLPVFVVDDHPDAIRADLELDIQGYYIHNTNGERHEEPLNHHFTLESRREQEGYFRFGVELPYVDTYDQYGNDLNRSHGSAGYALDLLAQTFTNIWTVISTQSNASVTATVRLFNENNELIVARDLVLRTMTEESTTNE